MIPIVLARNTSVVLLPIRTRRARNHIARIASSNW